MPSAAAARLQRDERHHFALVVPQPDDVDIIYIRVTVCIYVN